MDRMSGKGRLVVRAIAIGAAAGAMMLPLAGCNVNRGMEGASRVAAGSNISLYSQLAD